MAKNETPFEHRGPNGTVFRSLRCDFKDGVTAILPRRWIPKLTSAGGPGLRSLEEFATDVATMIGFHAVHTRPELNGFGGYDTVKFNFEFAD